MNIEPDTTFIEEYQVVLEEKNETKQSVLKRGKTKLEVIIDEVCKEAEVSLADTLRRTKIQKYSDVRKAIVRLSEKYSDITNKELAEKLNIPPSMVSKIISGESHGTPLVDEIVHKIEEKGIIQA